MTSAWLVAWLATYTLHALFLGLVALLVTRGAWAMARPRWVELVWRTAVLGALLTTTVQVASGAAWSPAPRFLLEDATLSSNAASETARPNQLASSDGAAGAASGCDHSSAQSSQDAALGSLSSAETCTAAGALGAVDPLGGMDPSGPTLTAPAKSWTFWVASAWAVLVLFGLTRLATGWLAFRRLLSGRSSLRSGTQRAALDGLLGSSRLSTVELSAADDLCTPIAFGVQRPEIVVPSRSLDEFGSEEFQTLIAHELAHLERRDPLWILGLRVLAALFPFQPFLPLARRRLAAAAEDLCDQSAVERTGLSCELALCLTRVAEWMRGTTQSLPAAQMAASGSQLERRIDRLVNGASDQTRVPGLGAWLTLSLGLAVWIAPGFAVGCASPDSTPLSNQQAGTVREGEPQTTAALSSSSAPENSAARAQQLLPIVVSSLDELLLETRRLQTEVETLGMTTEATRLDEIDQRLSVLRSRSLDLLAIYQ